MHGPLAWQRVIGTDAPGNPPFNVRPLTETGNKKVTQQQAVELQDQWNKLGNLPCEHPTQKLGRSEAGYLTGVLYCVQCGFSIDNSPKDPTTSLKNTRAFPRFKT